MNGLNADKIQSLAESAERIVISRRKRQRGGRENSHSSISSLNSWGPFRSESRYEEGCLDVDSMEEEFSEKEKGLPSLQGKGRKECSVQTRLLFNILIHSSRIAYRMKLQRPSSSSSSSTLYSSSGKRSSSLSTPRARLEEGEEELQVSLFPPKERVESSTLSTPQNYPCTDIIDLTLSSSPKNEEVIRRRLGVARVVRKEGATVRSAPQIDSSDVIHRQRRCYSHLSFYSSFLEDHLNSMKH